MPISFNSILPTIRTPGTYVEVDPSNALQGLSPWYNKVLFIGQMIPADIATYTSWDDSGSATANELVFVASAEKATELFGPGSQLARMIEKFKAINPYLETWAIPLGNGTGAPTADITLGGSPTAAGAIHLLQFNVS